jgi:hypothetical protein
MPRRSISETQTGSLREEQIERVVVAVISAWSIRPPSGEAPLAHEGSYQERSLKSYSLNEENVITTSIGCGGLERQRSRAYSE